MKTIRTLFLWLLLMSNGNQHIFAQCRAGYNPVKLNWDYLDFLVNTGSYDNGYLHDEDLAFTQHFSFGTNRLTIDASPGLSLYGENNEHTAQPGEDVQFFAFGDNSITISFEQEVYNLQFSLFDIDFGMRVTVTAANSLGNAPVLLSKAMSSSGISFVGNQIRGYAGLYNNSDNRGTVNIQVNDAVKTITLSFSNAINEFWLSDLSACSPGSFPTNYYEVSKPFTRQPAYVLHSFNNSVYAVNPANGSSKFIFTDNTADEINSMGYDPHKHILYYAGNNKTLRKYDFNTGVSSTVLQDITSIGIPVSSDMGIESGGAAFYNGCLYLGIETATGNERSDRESVIWRIDFNAANVPVRASQVFAMPVDNGSGTRLHNWGDFVINDGVLYNFDGANNQTDIYEVNLLSGNASLYSDPDFVPGEAAVDWNGKIYQLYANAGNNTRPYIAGYEDGDLMTGTKFNITSPAQIPRLADAAEAYRPASDLGDAPASYSNNAEPATHERDANLRLGSTFDQEWALTAAGDGADEDAIGQAPALNINGRFNYTVSNISVYNNTGATATLIAWLDYNVNGIFEPGEAVSALVSSRSNQQYITLNWTNINVPAAADLRTFLRIRLTSTSNGMTAMHANGWYNNGEVEDYSVLLSTILAKSDPIAKIDTVLLAGKTWPNPAIEYVTTQVTARHAGEATVQLINNMGHLVMIYQKSIIAGNNNLRINDLATLPKGVYTIRIVVNNSVLLSKFVIGN